MTWLNIEFMRHIVDDQGAIVVKRVRTPAIHRDLIRDDSQQEVDSKRIPSGIPDKFFDLSSHFKMIQRENSIKDEELNKRIQREGAHYNGSGNSEQPLTGSEAEWYVHHKGYSERIKL